MARNTISPAYFLFPLQHWYSNTPGIRHNQTKQRQQVKKTKRNWVSKWIQMIVHEETMTLEQASGGGWQILYAAPDWFRNTTCNTRKHMTLNTNMICKAAKSTRFDTLPAVTVNMTMLCDLMPCVMVSNKHYTQMTGAGRTHLQDG